MNFVSLITKKRDGGEWTEDEIHQFVRGIVTGEIPDYGAASWLMAAFLKGMNRAETLALTLAMRDSGETVDLSDLALGPVPPLDKHSTGGVGDKTTLVVVSMLASAGVPMLKMSGRGLGHTGGTIDKLEAIPGFRTELTLSEAKRQTSRIGAALIAQSKTLVPADKILYALRDAAGTVESVPLIASSIMSKKLAAGSARILLDVKVGRGAFMETQPEAERLARTMIEIGTGAGVPTGAVLTAMDEPLGKTIGNALEVREALDVLTLKPDLDPRFRTLCVELTSHGLISVGLAQNPADGQKQAEALLTSGKAAQKLAQISAAQGGPGDLESLYRSLPPSALTLTIKAEKNGFVHRVDAKALGSLAMRLGAGRERKEDSVDPSAGIELYAKCGVPIEKEQPLAVLHFSSTASLSPDALISLFQAAVTLKPEPLSEERPLILTTLW